ncbi:unnamed protein product [Spirodela intermedia]|uniref:Uncharacterized protein n=1 Tax=Spirodela intermedia TaxID=51605 RepID=A0A7I8KVR1_SPIIN|nr:unnamed protein product [Spirodela intermedia]
MEGRRGIDKLIDERLNGDYDEEQADLVLRVALLCVRTDKDERPAMSTVVGFLLATSRRTTSLRRVPRR